MPEEFFKRGQLLVFLHFALLFLEFLFKIFVRKLLLDGHSLAEERVRKSSFSAHFLLVSRILLFYVPEQNLH